MERKRGAASNDERQRADRILSESSFDSSVRLVRERRRELDTGKRLRERDTTTERETNAHCRYKVGSAAHEKGSAARPAKGAQRAVVEGGHPATRDPVKEAQRISLKKATSAVGEAAAAAARKRCRTQRDAAVALRRAERERGAGEAQSRASLAARGAWVAPLISPASFSLAPKPAPRTAEEQRWLFDVDVAAEQRAQPRAPRGLAASAVRHSAQHPSTGGAANGFAQLDGDEDDDACEVDDLFAPDQTDAALDSLFAKDRRAAKPTPEIVFAPPTIAAPAPTFMFAPPSFGLPAAAASAARPADGDLDDDEL